MKTEHTIDIPESKKRHEKFMDFAVEIASGKMTIDVGATKKYEPVGKPKILFATNHIQS